MILVPIKNIRVKKDSFKEYSLNLRKEILLSIEKYGQIKPIYIQRKDDGMYDLIDGYLILSILCELGDKEVYCVEIDTKLTEFDLFDLQLKLNLRGDINILTLSKKIDEFLELNFSIEEISSKTDISYEKICVLKNLINVKFQTFTPQKEVQQSLF